MRKTILLAVATMAMTTGARADGHEIKSVLCYLNQGVTAQFKRDDYAGIFPNYEAHLEIISSGTGEQMKYEVRVYGDNTPPLLVGSCDNVRVTYDF